MRNVGEEIELPIDVACYYEDCLEILVEKDTVKPNSKGAK
jgi:hypothetical protein